MTASASRLLFLSFALLLYGYLNHTGTVFTTFRVLVYPLQHDMSRCTSTAAARRLYIENLYSQSLVAQQNN